MSTSETNPLTPVAEHLIGGVVTLLIGLAFMVAARGFSVLALPGLICVAAGVGLLFAGCFVYPFIKRPGQTG